MLIDAQLLQDVHPTLGKFARWAEEQVRGDFDVKVSSGFRSFEEQAKLHADYLAGKGGKAAPPGQSAHNFGLAIDVYPAEHGGVIRANGQPGAKRIFLSDSAKWDRLGALVWQFGDAHPSEPKLKWGHSFDDDPHVEVAGWEDDPKLRAWRSTSSAPAAPVASSSAHSAPSSSSSGLAEPSSGRKRLLLAGAGAAGVAILGAGAFVLLRG